MKKELTFTSLIESIQQIHDDLTVQARLAVNVSLTMRNWLIGCYIAEYELRGADRARYGDRLLVELAKELHNASNCNRRQLYRYLRFYRFYPQIVGTLTPQFKNFLHSSIDIAKMGTASTQLQSSGNVLLQTLSYRLFYELESIRGNWSVRELRRQIGSLYYERSGLSKDNLISANLPQHNKNVILEGF